ncbi:hypothetical protein Bca101_096796 [Brassica carinata]
MVQIHPVQTLPVDSGVREVKSSPYVTTEQESFTIWMRSLVCHSKGCTVYDSKGNLIYRVDNYDSKSCGEVYLMDLYREVLFEFQQSFGLFKSCEGCNSNGTRFRLRKNFKISPRGSSSSYKAVMESSKDDQQSCYKILNHRSVFIIEDGSGRLMAEVKKKQSNVNGLDFGEDVLTMVVEPQVDHSFIMGWCATTSSGRSITECSSCGRVDEECQTQNHHLFHFCAQDTPLCLVTSDLHTPPQPSPVDEEDPFEPTRFITAFSTWSLEPNPIFSRSSFSFSGHLAELEQP